MRLGATSFLEPADYVSGFRHAAALCDDVCLLAMCAGPNREYLISKAEVCEIARIADGEGVSVNVHLPCEHDFGSSASARQLAEDVACVIERTALLNPHTFVLHVAFPALNNVLLGPNPQGLNISEEQMAYTAAVLHDIAALLPGPEYLAVENLEALPPSFWDMWLDAAPYSRCADIGHLWKDGWDAAACLTSWLERVRIVHLHGMEPGLDELVPEPVASRKLPATPVRRRLNELFGVLPHDHKSLHHMPADMVDAVMHVLWRSSWSGVLNIEVFHTEDFLASYDVLSRSWERYEARREHDD